MQFLFVSLDITNVADFREKILMTAELKECAT